MALLKGKGAMTGVSLIAAVYRNGVTKDGKSVYADLQIDVRDSRGAGQTNLHLKSERVTGDDGVTRYNNGARYTISQMDEISAAAGDNKTPLLTKDGEEVGTLYGFKGNVMPATQGSGLVVNTKSVEASDLKVDGTTIAAQFEAMAQAKEANTAAKAAEPVAEQVAEAEAQAAMIDEPAFG